MSSPDYADGFELARGSEYPWERLKGETMKAFEAFAVYRDLGNDRSIPKVAQELSKSIPLLKKWSVRWGWVRRVQLYQLYLDRQRQAEVLEDIREMPSRLANYGRWMQAKAQERIRDIRPEDLTPEQARRYMETGARIEREAMSLVDAEELARKMAASGDWRQMLPAGVSEADARKAIRLMAQSIADAANKRAGMDDDKGKE
jgi:hypothetical protein